MANEMADDAIMKAVHPWLKTFAQNMKADQTREIAQYREIRRLIAGSDTTPDPMMNLPMPAGPNFDREWILMMVDHHQGAINNSLLAHGAGVQIRLDSLAHHTIDEQKICRFGHDHPPNRWRQHGYPNTSLATAWTGRAHGGIRYPR